MTKHTTFTRKILARRGGRNPFETRLLIEGYTTHDQFDIAIKVSQEESCSLLEAIESLIGQVLPPEISRFYKRSRLFELSILHGMRAIDRDIDFDLFDIPTISILVDIFIPIHICRSHHILPLRMVDSVLTIGVVNFKTVEEIIEFHPDLSKYKLDLRLIAPEDYKITCDSLFDFFNSHDPKLNADFEPDLPQLTDSNFDGVKISSLVDNILVKSIAQGASEILIEPLDKQLRLKLRIDGKLKDFEPQLPLNLRNVLINRFKIIADLDTTKRQVPQIGTFKRVFKKRQINFHVNTLPIATGEKIVVKIFDSIRIGQTIDSLVVNASGKKIIKYLCNQESGLIVVTGENKNYLAITKTLYSLFEYINTLGKAGYTVEEKIGFPLPTKGITQLESTKNLDLVGTLGLLQQHNPEFLLVNEIISPELFHSLIEVTKNCLTLTSLPTNHLVIALAQLMTMANPALVASSLSSIIFQYPLRRLCTRCCIPYHADKTKLKICGIDANEHENIFYSAWICNPNPKIQGDRICPQCNGTGYKGWINAFEIMVVDDQLRSEIAKGTSPIKIRELAVSQGMQTLLDYSIDLAKRAYVSLEDIIQMIVATTLPEGIDLPFNQPPHAQNFNSVSSQTSQGIRNFDPEEIFLSIVGSLDLLDFTIREVSTVPSNSMEVFSSYQHMREQLLQLLQKSGITSIEVNGRKFDPNLHELIQEEKTTSHPANVTLTQFRRGYLLGDRVLRRAQVQIAVYSE